MKVAILAGGVGSRLSEETVVKPKPMVEVGGRPILWHIMKGYAAQGFSDFVIALGYKGEVIKEWMINYAPLSANLTVHTQSRIGGARHAGGDRGLARSTHRHGTVYRDRRPR